MIRAHVLICGGTGCTSSGSKTLQEAFNSSLEKFGLTEEIKMVQTGCFGLCALGPIVIVYPDGTFYSRVTPEDVKEFKLIPYGNGAEFIMDAGELTTESKVVVPVFECKAPYKTFMADLSHQELVNLIDSEKNLNRYPGVKVGDMYQATNDAGNWE